MNSNEKDSADSKPDYKAYGEFVKMANDRAAANQSEYDKALLSLSSAFLLVSVSFLSNVVNLDEARVSWLLQLAWAMLTLAILATLLSFQVSEWYIERLREGAKGYYLAGGKKELMNDSKRLASRMRYMNWLNGGIFAAGVLSLTLFVAINTLEKERRNMDENDILKKGQPVPSFDQIPSGQSQSQSQSQTQTQSEQSQQSGSQPQDKR